MNVDIPKSSPPLTTNAVKIQDVLIAETMVLKGDMLVDGGTITGLADPTQLTEPATKNYVDNAVNNAKWKDPVRVATTANITLSGAQTIDGVAVVADDRVLVKTQSSATENGIYVASATAWSRSVDMAAGSEAAGVSMWVNEGTAGGDKSFICTDDTGADIVGTDPLTFVQFGSETTITAGNGLILTGNTISVNVDDATIEIVADTLQVKDLGITNAKLANSSLTVTAGNGLTGGGLVTLGGTVNLDLNVDNATIEIVGDVVRVKDAGITNAKLTNSSITVTAGAGLTGGGTISLGGSGNLDANVDGTTIEISADTIQLMDTAVVAGSYTNTNLTVDAQGRLTAAATSNKIVSMHFSWRDLFSTPVRFANWGGRPANQDTLANTIRIGRAGTITSATFTYLDSTAIAIGIGDSATFDIGTISGGSGTDADGTFVALAGGAAVLVWDNSNDATWPSTTVNGLSIAVLESTQLAIRCTQSGTLTQANAELNGIFWLEV